MTFIKYTPEVIACIELALALLKYWSESRRLKYYNTIDKTNNLIDELYSLRESYLYLSGASSNKLFDYSIIQNNNNIYFRKKIMRLLTEFEGFAEGMERDIYDYQLYITLIPKEVIEIYVHLREFIIEERKKLSYTLLFDKSELFIRHSEKAFDRKSKNLHIPIKYKPKGC